MNTGLNIGTRGGGWEGARGVFCKQIPIGPGCYVELDCISHIWLDCVVLFYLPDLSYDSSVFMWHFLGNITAWIIYSECFPNHKTSRLQRVFICTVMFCFVFCCVVFFFNVAFFVCVLMLLVKTIHEAFALNSINELNLEQSYLYHTWARMGLFSFKNCVSLLSTWCQGRLNPWSLLGLQRFRGGDNLTQNDHIYTWLCWEDPLLYHHLYKPWLLGIVTKIGIRGWHFSSCCISKTHQLHSGLN